MCDAVARVCFLATVTVVTLLALRGGGQADLFCKHGIETTIGQRPIMVTQSFKGILGPLGHLSANLGLDRI